MSNQFSHRKSAGFTMLEMAIAAAILAMAVGGFYATFGGSNDFAVRARLRNSAKVILGAALNEALGSRWIKSQTAPYVLQPCIETPYDLGALPGFPDLNHLNIGITPAVGTLGRGDVSLFTDPSQTSWVNGKLTREVAFHPEFPSGSVVMVTFKFTYTYKGVPSQPMYAYTVVARLD
jgi:prepilin-type N-terminal cleavage/methylation domain-containing protein